ncbi:MAG: hypothetical protein GY847_38330 [Proteobacteria bacterium]|nr:hypothetical protein [Pseudomonadota bacterium]
MQHVTNVNDSVDRYSQWNSSGLRDQSQMSLLSKMFRVCIGNGMHTGGIAVSLNDLVAKCIVKRRIVIKDQLRAEDR